MNSTWRFLVLAGLALAVAPLTETREPTGRCNCATGRRCDDKLDQEATFERVLERLESSRVYPYGLSWQAGPHRRRNLHSVVQLKLNCLRNVARCLREAALNLMDGRHGESKLDACCRFDLFNIVPLCRAHNWRTTSAAPSTSMRPSTSEAPAFGTRTSKAPSGSSSARPRTSKPPAGTTSMRPKSSKPPASSRRPETSEAPEEPEPPTLETPDSSSTAAPIAEPNMKV